MSDTPRTDKAIIMFQDKQQGEKYDEFVPAYLSRQLEQEINKLKLEIEKLKPKKSENEVDDCRSIRKRYGSYNDYDYTDNCG